MVARIKREAEKRGSLCFVTVTYDDEHLPLAQSLWSVSKSTGEYTLECPAEIISSARFPDPLRLSQDVRAVYKYEAHILARRHKIFVTPYQTHVYMQLYTI